MCLAPEIIYLRLGIHNISLIMGEELYHIIGPYIS